VFDEDKIRAIPEEELTGAIYTPQSIGPAI
jgi:hypothetical protein